MFEQPLGDEHHEDALAAALGVPDDAAFALGDALLRGLHAVELMYPRNLLSPRIKDDEVPNQIEHPGLLAHLRQGPIEQGTGADLFGVDVLFGLPRHEEFFVRRGGAVAQTLGVVAREEELSRGKEPLIENLLLICDELAYAVGQFDGAALQFDHADGDAVEVNHHVRTPFVTTAQGHLLGDRKIIPFRMVPVHQVHRRERLIDGGLHRHAVTEKLIRAQIGLVKGDARGVGGGFQFSQRGGNLGAGVAARLEIRGQQARFDAAVVFPFAPVPEVAIAKVVAARGVGEESDDAVLRAAFGAGVLAHRLTFQ